MITCFTVAGGQIIKTTRIIVIEKDETTRLKASAALEQAGYEVTTAADAADGLKKIYEARPDLIVMGGELPMVNGEDPLLRVRQASYLPIIVLGSKEKTVEALESGVDAYMTKPLSSRELVARVRVLLRRRLRHDPTGEDCESEIKNYLTEGEDCPQAFTPTESRLASYFIFNKGRVLSYPQIIGGVWGSKRIKTDTLHFYVRQLRRKLKNISIFGVRGVGYCFLADEVSNSNSN